MKKDWSFKGELQNFTLSHHSEIANYFVEATKDCVERIITDKFNQVMEKILEEYVVGVCKTYVKKLVDEKIDTKYKEMESSIDKMIEDHLKQKIDNYFEKKKKKSG